MNVVAVLRLQDGREFIHSHSMTPEPDEPFDEFCLSVEFYWTDGNNACDCNRSSMINKDHGLDLDESCGDSRVELISLKIQGREMISKTKFSLPSSL